MCTIYEFQQVGMVPEKEIKTWLPRTSFISHKRLPIELNEEEEGGPNLPSGGTNFLFLFQS